MTYLDPLKISIEIQGPLVQAAGRKCHETTHCRLWSNPVAPEVEMAVDLVGEVDVVVANVSGGEV